MFIRHMRTVLAATLALLLLLPLPVVAAAEETAPEGIEKIESQLLEKMETAEGKLGAFVWLRDLDYNTQAERVKHYPAYREAFLQKVGVSAEDVLMEETYAPMVAVLLTAEDIYRLAAMEDVVAIYFLNTEPPEMVVCTYDTTQARRILEVAVGKRLGSFTWEYDVDYNMDINTTDARLALQSAVGKIVITRPKAITPPEAQQTPA